MLLHIGTIQYAHPHLQLTKNNNIIMCGLQVHYTIYFYWSWLWEYALYLLFSWRMNTIQCYSQLCLVFCNRTWYQWMWCIVICFSFSTFRRWWWDGVCTYLWSEMRSEVIARSTCVNRMIGKTIRVWHFWSYILYDVCTFDFWSSSESYELWCCMVLYSSLASFMV